MRMPVVVFGGRKDVGSLAWHNSSLRRVGYEYSALFPLLRHKYLVFWLLALYGVGFTFMGVFFLQFSNLGLSISNQSYDILISFQIYVLYSSS